MATQPRRSRVFNTEFFDEAALLRHVDGDRELLKQIVELFLETTPELLADIRDAIARADGKSLRLAAHALRGSARNFYASSVERAALVLEQLGETYAFEGAQSAYVALQTELGKLNPLLLAMVRHEGQ